MCFSASLTVFTIAMAGPTNDVRTPRNRAVVMLVSLLSLGWRVGIVVVAAIPLTLGAVFVIMLITESSPSMKERGKAAGIKGWIVKPFKGAVVLETFKKLSA